MIVACFKKQRLHRFFSSNLADRGVWGKEISKVYKLNFLYNTHSIGQLPFIVVARPLQHPPATNVPFYMKSTILSAIT